MDSHRKVILSVAAHGDDAKFMAGGGQAAGRAVDLARRDGMRREGRSVFWQGRMSSFQRRTDAPQGSPGRTGMQCFATARPYKQSSVEKSSDSIDQLICQKQFIFNITRTLVLHY